MLLNDLQCAFAQAAGLAGVRRKADAALALRRRAQGLDRLFVGIVQVAESGKFTADANAGTASQGTVRQLADLIGQNVQVFFKVRGVAQQQSHGTPAAIKYEMPQIFVGALLHQV